MDKGFVIRGAGAGAACLVPDRRWRAAVLAGSYVAGWFGGEHGIQILSVTGAELPTSTLSWTAAHLLATAGLRRLPVPLVVAAPAYAALVAWLDTKTTAGVRAKLEAAGVST